jgi:hypothetical protein
LTRWIRNLFVLVSKRYLITFDKITTLKSIEFLVGTIRSQLMAHIIFAQIRYTPKLSEVITFCPEPILKQDGAVKNDCERNAFYRLLDKLVEDHPKLKSNFVLEGLYSVAPIIREQSRNTPTSPVLQLNLYKTA